MIKRFIFILFAISFPVCGQQSIEKILTFDGGGIRGLISLYIVNEIEQKLEAPITDYVNCFAGTSTGSIIAVGYASGMTTQQLISVYQNEAHRMFSRSFYHQITSLWGLRKAKYNTFNLEETLKENYGIDVKLSNLQKDVIIPVANLTTGQGEVFSTFKAKKHPENNEINLPTWKTVRASTSAPSIYKPVSFRRDEALVDGGLFANNPTLTAFGEIKDEFGWNAAQNLNIISIGTGHVGHGLSYSIAKSMGAIRWARPISKTIINISAKATHQLMAKLMSPEKYIRLNPTLSHAIELDCYSKQTIQDLQQASLNFIAENPTLIAQAVNMLKPSTQTTAIMTTTSSNSL